jgi:hypothetical protein
MVQLILPLFIYISINELHSEISRAMYLTRAPPMSLGAAGTSIIHPNYLRSIYFSSELNDSLTGSVGLWFNMKI